MQQTDTYVCRETTVLEAKLEKLAGLIGQIGLGAGLLAFGALASQFSWQKFVVEGQSWDWAFAPEYLRFLITSITILVCSPATLCPALPCATLLDLLILLTPFVQQSALLLLLLLSTLFSNLYWSTCSGAKLPDISSFWW